MIRKPLHDTTKQGLLVFPEQEQILQLKYHRESFWQSTAFLVLIMVIGGAMNIAAFNNLFSSFLYDSPMVRDLCIAGMVLAFDIAPVPMAFNLSKWHYGYRVSAFAIVVPLAGFLIAVAANMALRIVTADLAFPDLASAGTSIIGSGSTATTGTSTRTIIFAAFFGLLPVCVGLISFGIAFTSQHPLKRELKNLDRICLIATANRNEISTILAEYEADADFENRLLEEDSFLFQATLDQIHAQRDDFMAYTKLRISEHLGDPAATSYLSKTHINKEEE